MATFPDDDGYNWLRKRVLLLIGVVAALAALLVLARAALAGEVETQSCPRGQAEKVMAETGARFVRIAQPGFVRLVHFLAAVRKFAPAADSAYSAEWGAGALVVFARAGCFTGYSTMPVPLLRAVIEGRPPPPPPLPPLSGAAKEV